MSHMSLPQNMPDRAQTVWHITMPNGETFPCRQQQSVLEAMRHAGCTAIPSGCFGGGCGVCRMRVAAGPYRRFQPMSRAHVSPQAEQDGFVLLCCIQPLGDLLLADA